MRRGGGGHRKGRRAWEGGGREIGIMSGIVSSQWSGRHERRV